MKGIPGTCAAGCLAVLLGCPAVAAETAPDHLRSGEAHLTRGLPGEALKEFRAALALDPTLVEARAGAAKALLALKDFQRALGEADEALRLAPARIDLARLAAMAHYRAGDYPAANRLFSGVLQQDPRDAEARYYLGRMLLPQFSNQAALEFFEGAVSLQPGNALYHHYRGVALRRLGRLAESDAAFREAARLAPGQAGPPLYLGWNALDRGEYADAERQLREAIRLDPSLAQAHFRLALVLIKKKDYPSAAASLRKAIDLFPSFDLAWYNLGKCHQWMGQTAEAQKAFARFRQLEPVSNRITELRQTLVRSPGDEKARRELMELLGRVGDPSGVLGDP
jgi:tetratricopeptide (TPR) repeat protein